MTIAEPTDGNIFLAYLEQGLCPGLRPGQVVIMDHLSAHKVEGVRQHIEAAGARRLYLPAYSPDPNPIEQAWSKLKQLLRASSRSTHIRSSGNGSGGGAGCDFPSERDCLVFHCG